MRPPRALRRGLAGLLWTAASLGLLLALWQQAAVAWVANPFILPEPAAVLEGLGQVAAGYMGGTVLTHVAASLGVVLTGYAIALLVAVPLGIAMAWWRPLDIVFAPLLAVLRPIPPPAWIPLAILWFGIGLGGKVFVIAMAASVPCLINAHLAIRERPPALMAAAATLGASRATLLFRVAIPAGLPTILAGARIALGNAWATVVAAELVVATAGLGFLILAGYRNLEANIMAGAMVTLGLCGLAMTTAFRWLERRLVPWAPGGHG